MNSVAETITAWPREQAHGRQIEEVFRLINLHSRESIHVVISGEGNLPGSARPSLLRNKGNDEFMVAKTVAPIRRSDSEVTGMVAVFRDVSKQLELEAKVRQAQRMESLGLLAGGIAHDFNNILGGIMAYAELLGHSLGSGQALGQAEEEYPQKIVASSKRAAALTRQLLTFAKKRDPELKNVDVHRLIQCCISFLKRTIKPSVLISEDLQAPEPVVKADFSLLESVFINLGINAADAMEDGGNLSFATRELCIDQSFILENEDLNLGDHLEVCVTDTGCGMPAEVQGRIFEPFFSTKGPGKGTGLGLSTAFGTVQSLGELISFHPAVKVIVISGFSLGVGAEDVLALGAPDAAKHFLAVIYEFDPFIAMYTHW